MPSRASPTTSWSDAAGPRKYGEVPRACRREATRQRGNASGGTGRGIGRECPDPIRRAGTRAAHDPPAAVPETAEAYPASRGRLRAGHRFVSIMDCSANMVWIRATTAALRVETTTLVREALTDRPTSRGPANGVPATGPS